MVTYGTTGFNTVTIEPSDSVQVSAAFDASVALIGNYDAGNGSASTEQVYEVDGPSEARTLFGDNSELANQYQLAVNNGAATVYAVAPSETLDQTESFSSTDGSGSGDSLSNTPVLNPNLHNEHDISAQDTSEAVSVTVNIVYDDTPSQPTDSNTINLNPYNGEWRADASSSYDITYDYLDYTGAIQDSGLVDESPRYISVLQEQEGVASDLLTEIDAESTVFNFMRGLVGGQPKPDSTSVSSFVSNYSDSLDDQRMIVVEPPFGTFDGTLTRIHGALAGHLAGKELGDSATFETLTGFESLRTTYDLSNGKDFAEDSQVLTVADANGDRIVRSVTTSTTTEFSRVHKVEIIDEVAELSHLICQDYLGEDNTQENRELLEDDHRALLRGFQVATPPLLDAYSVTVKEDSTDDSRVIVDLGVDIVDVMETIDVTVAVGTIITNET